MSMIKTIAFALMTAFATTGLRAELTVAEQHVPDADLVGEARLKVMLWNVFDARLYATGGQYDTDAPFALSLSYLRKLKGEQIVDKTISEMEQQGKYDRSELESWSLRLAEIIKDVDASTTITGVRDVNGHTLFYRNGDYLGKIEDADFTRGFFAIWLGEGTSNPRFRQQLMGTRPS